MGIGTVTVTQTIALGILVIWIIMCYIHCIINMKSFLFHYVFMDYIGLLSLYLYYILYNSE